MIQPLIDQFKRKINYLRLSITDRCDFRCVYCMNEDMTFLPRDEVLSLEESLRLVKIFVSLGITKLRVTGGEPLVRKNIAWLFHELGQIEDLKEVVLDRKSTRLNSSHVKRSRMPSSA